MTQWRRENFYLYGLVEPLTGENFIWEFPHLNTECFNIFLKQFYATYPEDVHILQLDNGAFHQVPVSSGARSYNSLVSTTTYTAG